MFLDISTTKSGTNWLKRVSAKNRRRAIMSRGPNCYHQIPQALYLWKWLSEENNTYRKYSFLETSEVTIFFVYSNIHLHFLFIQKQLLGVQSKLSWVHIKLSFLLLMHFKLWIWHFARSPIYLKNFPNFDLSRLSPCPDRKPIHLKSTSVFIHIIL